LGCGRKQPTFLDVRGRVTQEGSPVEGAVVTFYPTAEAGPTPNGVTDQEGTFSFSAGPGEYKVVVAKYDPDFKGPRAQRRQSLLPAVYARPSSTPLQCSVPPRGPLTFDIGPAE
jgi:hypothetical protein